MIYIINTNVGGFFYSCLFYFFFIFFHFVLSLVDIENVDNEMVIHVLVVGCSTMFAPRLVLCIKKCYLCNINQRIYNI